MLLIKGGGEGGVENFKDTLFYNLHSLQTRISWGDRTNIIIVVFTVAGIAATDPYETASAYRNKFQNQSTGGGVFTNKFLDEVEEVSMLRCFVCILSIS